MLQKLNIFVLSFAGLHLPGYKHLLELVNVAWSTLCVQQQNHNVPKQSAPDRHSGLMFCFPKSALSTYRHL